MAPHIRSGAVRPLAVTGSRRSQAFRDIPTMAESGYPGFVINPWFGFFAPAGTPAAVVAKINADLNRVLEDRDTIEKFAAQGAEVLSSTPQELAAMLHQDIQTWAQVVRQSGARVD